MQKEWPKKFHVENVLFKQEIFYEGMTKDDIINKWNFDGKVSSEAGTKMHEDIEYYFNNQPRENDSIEYQYFKKFFEIRFYGKFRTL